MSDFPFSYFSSKSSSVSSVCFSADPASTEKASTEKASCAQSRRYAVLFPGQGSQSVGMLSDFAAEYPVVGQVFSEASDVLGFDLWASVQHGTAAQLAQTQVTQPLMLVAGVAVWRVWAQQMPYPPAYFAGHSLGEYTALVCAEALSLADAVRVVEARARFMQSAIPADQGAMVAVLGLGDHIVIDLCKEAAVDPNGQDACVQAVNFNAPQQVVIGGHKEAVARAVVLAQARGAKKIIPVAMSVPSHCVLMKPAADQLRELLSTMNLREPQIAVMNNVDLLCESDPFKIKDALSRQVYSPVRWSDLVACLVDSGRVNALLEVGTGRVLTGLNKRICPDVRAQAFNAVTAAEGALSLFIS